MTTALETRTFLPNREVLAPEGEKRKLHGVRAEELFSVIGAAVASLATTMLIFGWFTPLTGGVGFVVVAYFLFLIFYVMLTSFNGQREEIKDRIVTVLLYSAGFILVSSLLFVVVFTLIRGQDAFPHLNFFTQTMELAGPLDGLDVGGIIHAIVGTLFQIGIALLITIPLGITTAVFLNEIGGNFARFVRTISDAMTALPSIVAGLFIFSALIRTGILQKSGLARPATGGQTAAALRRCA